MRVLALSDLHLDHPENLAGIAALPPHPDDWLILAGDLGHRERDLLAALELLGERFARLIWVPGNHDLWSMGADAPAGEARYQRLVELCRARGVLTPEDPYAELELDRTRYALVPLFLLYDYSFRPEEVSLEGAVAWALEKGLLCADELYLRPTPHPSIDAWCRARLRLSEERLDQVPRDRRLILINHFPLREDQIRIRIPRFRIWCGTRETLLWHQRFNVAVVVSGHLHVRATEILDGVRFEEVSLGYPKQWDESSGVEAYLRQILPEPAP
jgi:3',5'-cyclic AMP phosphodiesterase CpdA